MSQFRDFNRYECNKCINGIFFSQKYIVEAACSDFREGFKVRKKSMEIPIPRFSTPLPRLWKNTTYFLQVFFAFLKLKI